MASSLLDLALFGLDQDQLGHRALLVGLCNGTEITISIADEDGDKS